VYTVPRSYQILAMIIINVMRYVTQLGVCKCTCCML